MTYQVQRGDTIAKVTQILKINWEKLRSLNPKAVGRSTKTGNWFLKEGELVKSRETFNAVLHQQIGINKQSITSKTLDDSERWLDYTVKSGDTLWALAVKRFHVNIEDLIKDNCIKEPDKLYPGQKIRVRIPSFPQQQEVVASWYGESYHGRPMANGESYNMYANTIAHKDLPFGTRVELKNLETGQSAEAVITDRGPYIEGRDVDLSYGLAQKLTLVEKGVGKLLMRILG